MSNRADQKPEDKHICMVENVQRSMQVDIAVLGCEDHLASCVVVELEGYSGLLGFKHNLIFAREEFERSTATVTTTSR